jgi:hypothetical protein
VLGDECLKRMSAKPCGWHLYLSFHSNSHIISHPTSPNSSAMKVLEVGNDPGRRREMDFSMFEKIAASTR